MRLSITSLVLDLSMRSKLMLLFMAVGIIPTIAVTWIAVQRAGASLEAAKQYERQNLEAQLVAQLVANRVNKKAAIDDYFRRIEDQIVTFSQNRMVIDAMRDFSRTFGRYANESGAVGGNTADLAAKLRTYYSKEFSEEYRKQNQGRDPQAERYFEQLDDQAIHLQHAYIRANPHPLGSKEKLDRAPTLTSYDRVHGIVHPVIRTYLERFGYYDIFLVDHQTGRILYSVFKELDFATSLLDGPYRDTNFAQAFREARNLSKPDSVLLVDFARYTPSYEAPASFIASPIYDGDQQLGIAMFQMPLDRITQVMSLRAGLGEYGETYLVGPDGLMRSDSFRDPENRSVTASFRQPETGRAWNEAIRAAIEDGQTGETTIDGYLGERILSAYAPVDLGPFRWAILSERPESDLLDSIQALEELDSRSRTTLLLSSASAVALAALLISFVAVAVARHLTDPLAETVGVLEVLAAGDLTRSVRVRSNDEAGKMGAAMNTAISSMSRTVRVLAQSAEQLDRSAGDIHGVSQDISTAADQTSRQADEASSAADEVRNIMQTIASGIDQMGASISEIARSASDSARVATLAVGETQAVASSVRKFGESSAEIGSVVNLITEVAEKTNLLALNATIEAARAGDAGKGFAVVANEVKELAKATSNATEEIRSRIEAIRSDSQAAVSSIATITKVTHQINDIAGNIASAVEQQSATCKELGRNVTEAARESTAIAKSIASVAQAAGHTSEGAAGMRKSAETLSEMAQELTESVSRFRV